MRFQNEDLPRRDICQRSFTESHRLNMNRETVFKMRDFFKGSASNQWSRKNVGFIFHYHWRTQRYMKGLSPAMSHCVISMTLELTVGRNHLAQWNDPCYVVNSKLFWWMPLFNQKEIANYEVREQGTTDKQYFLVENSKNTMGIYLEKKTKTPKWTHVIFFITTKLLHMMN